MRLTRHRTPHEYGFGGSFFRNCVAVACFGPRSVRHRFALLVLMKQLIKCGQSRGAVMSTVSWVELGGKPSSRAPCEKNCSYLLLRYAFVLYVSRLWFGFFSQCLVLGTWLNGVFGDDLYYMSICLSIYLSIYLVYIYIYMCV